MLRKIGLAIWGLPGNVHFWWTVGIPAVPAMIAWLIAFAREASLWQMVIVVAGTYLLLLVATVVVLRRAGPQGQVSITGSGLQGNVSPPAPVEPEPQERRLTQDGPVSPLPEPQTASSYEPLSLEPVKRRGPPKPNGERDIYMSIQVTNKGSGRIQGCRGRLVKVQDYFSTPDGYERQDISHIHPAYLRWSPGDGGGDSTDFTTEAILDVAVIESWAEPVYQFLTANESLRPTNRLDYEQTGPFLTIEISAQSGSRVEQEFALGGHSRGFLKAPSEVEPVVTWRTWPL